jgi:hypothetical protein
MSTNTPIATQTLSSAAASVTFSSIPQGYTDLVLVTTANVSATGYSKLYFNNVTTSTYSATNLYGTGSVAGSARQTTGSGLGYIQCHYLFTGSNQAILQINLQNYSNSTTFKTCLIKESDATYELTAKAGLWQSTNAITSLTLERVTGNWSSGSTFSIYGIQVGASTQKAQGGNIVTSDGTYVYHTFTSSGYFIPSQALTADYLVVAGGGGGGGWQGGGGGAGGLRSTVTATGGGGTLETALSLTAQAYTVTIGAGGAGNMYTSGATFDTVQSGSNSVFSTITSDGGGRGGSYSGAGVSAANGGSGGGATDDNVFGTGTASQGRDGGQRYTGNPYNAGGGGGAGGVGGNASYSNGGAGGNGVAVAISGSSVTYAGGGGGGTAGNNVSSRTGGAGGSGGGGAGGNSTGTGSNSSGTGSAGTSGTIATGSGGGGAGYGSNSGSTFGGTGGNGGSGIVIIRYAI